MLMHPLIYIRQHLTWLLGCLVKLLVLQAPVFFMNVLYIFKIPPHNLTVCQKTVGILVKYFYVCGEKKHRSGFSMQ